MPRRSALLLVLAIGLLHPLTQARLRPLYQVSDEMAYLRAAQIIALEDAPPAARRCIAPPDGVPFELGEGGKAGFRQLTAWQLRWLCRHGGPLPLFAVRAWQALSLPLVALAAWMLAWELSASTSAALVAALLVALHPVAAKYAAGVTPDAWANAFSAWALVAFTRLVIGRGHWWDVPLLGVCVAGGLLWKDTTHMLVPLAAIGVTLAAVKAWPRARARQGAAAWTPTRGLWIAGAVVVLLVGWRVGTFTSTAFVTPYIARVEPGTTAAVLASPGRFVQATVEDMVRQAPGFAASAWLSLYRPLVYTDARPWSQPLTPLGPTLVFGVVALLGLAGALKALTERPTATPRLSATVVAWWSLALLLCALQPSVRLVLLDISGVHQGRWLFPMLAPFGALLGIGVARVVRGAAAVPLVVVASLASFWVVLIDLVRHYYVRLPDVLDTRHLFTRPTGDVDVGDAAIVALIGQTTAAQAAWGTWGILVLLAATTLWLAWDVSRPVLPAEPHG